MWRLVRGERGGEPRKRESGALEDKKRTKGRLNLFNLRRKICGAVETHNGTQKGENISLIECASACCLPLEGN